MGKCLSKARVEVSIHSKGAARPQHLKKPKHPNDDVNDGDDGEDGNALAIVPEDVEYDDTVNFVPPISEGRVIKVYDGDTITIAAYLPYRGSPLYRFSVRLNGIDAPEMRTSDSNEKQVAQEAKEALSRLIFGKLVTLMDTDTDKYGRVLADVYLEDLNLCDWMLEHRFAVPYDGGTKKTPKDWVAYRKKGVC